MVLNYICRASKARKDGLSPIELSIIINGERSIITLDRRILSTKFNSSTQKVRGDKELNEYLDTIRKKCYHIENELIKTDSLDIDTFVHSFKYGLKKKEDSLLQVFDKHNELYKQSVLSGKVDNTAYYKYLKARERIAEYLSTQNLTDIKLNDITMSFIEGYQNYCLMSLKTNTTNKQLKMLKKILQFAVNERLMDVNPFKMVLKEEKLDYDVLTIEEVNELLCRNLVDERISRVRDLFCLQCYTGLAYIDLASLSKEDIVDDVIVKRRKKTDVQFVVPLFPAAKTILEKYDYKLPIISNQKYNMTLKVVGEIMGFKRNLHSHLARHTFACILLNSGVDMKTISRAMGHSSMRTTEKIYAFMSNESVVNNILQKLS
jgi:site-specific recombinase XerD